MCVFCLHHIPSSLAKCQKDEIVKSNIKRFNYVLFPGVVQRQFSEIFEVFKF